MAVDMIEWQILILSWSMAENRYHLTVYSPAQNQFDLELWYKVFFFTDYCRLDIAIKDSG